MPRFDIVKTTNADETFKVEQVKGAFDLQTSTIQEHFTGDIAIEGKEWNIGFIVGRSGTGKTTIAKEVFAAGYIEPHSYGTAAIVNEMPERNCPMQPSRKCLLPLAFHRRLHG